MIPREPQLTEWDLKFMRVARLVGSWSRDPNVKVGCVIVNDDHNQLSGGYNGFPRGIKDDARLDDREMKLKIVVHAEANAIAAAARNGSMIKGTTIYCTFCPCSQCASLIIQAGIKRCLWVRSDREHWKVNQDLAKSLLSEAGVMWVEAEGGYWI